MNNVNLNQNTQKELLQRPKIHMKTVSFEKVHSKTSYHYSQKFHALIYQPVDSLEKFLR